MSADNTWNLLGSTSRILSTTVLGNGGPAPSLSAVTFFVNFFSGATICHGLPVRRVPGIAQCMSRPTFASHNSVLGNGQNCSHSIMMTDKHSLSHAALQMNLHHLLQFYGTKLSHQHLQTACRESSCSCFSRLVVLLYSFLL